MEVEETRSGRAWRLWDGGHEVGVVLIARVRSARPMFSPYSAREGTWRWELGIAYSLAEAVDKVSTFDPEQPGVRTRVNADVVDRRL